MSRPLALRLLAWGVVLFGSFGCVDAGPLPAPSVPAAGQVCPAPPAPIAHALVTQKDSAKTEAVIVVVLDGARWQDVLVGVDPTLDERLVPSDLIGADRLMPNLHAMIARGAVIGAPERGQPMVASGPNYVSLPGYNEIFGGRTATLCRDNDCPQATIPTIVDEVRARPAPDGEGQEGEAGSGAAVFSSWAPISRAATAVPACGVSRLFVSTGQPRSGEFRADRATADLALAYLTEHRPRFLFMGLGEPDEEAHLGNYPGYLESLRQADDILGQLRDKLEAMGERGRRTSVFVTCDHGRGANFRDHGALWPESSRVWLVASGGAIPATGAVSSKTVHRLADIAPTVRALLGMPADHAAGAGAAIPELLSPEPLDPREARR